MCFSSQSWCGKCLLVFFSLLTVFSFWVFMSIDYIELLEEDDEVREPPLILENDRLPMLSPDRKTIYVASEDGLPIAHNFVLRNPSVPIEKIVFRKPGGNNTVHVYPIQRDALIATNHNFSEADVPGLCAFMFMLIFTSAGMYILMCREMCGCRCGARISASSSSSEAETVSCCDACFDFDPTTDFADLDDYFDSSDSSPGNSPIKQKKVVVKGKVATKDVKIPILDGDDDDDEKMVVVNEKQVVKEPLLIEV